MKTWISGFINCQLSLCLPEPGKSFQPLTPTTDQHLISPYNINPESQLELCYATIALEEI